MFSSRYLGAKGLLHSSALSLLTSLPLVTSQTQPPTSILGHLTDGGEWCKSIAVDGVQVNEDFDCPDRPSWWWWWLPVMLAGFLFFIFNIDRFHKVRLLFDFWQKKKELTFFLCQMDPRVQFPKPESKMMKSKCNRVYQKILVLGEKANETNFNCKVVIGFLVFYKILLFYTAVIGLNPGSGMLLGEEAEERLLPCPFNHQHRHGFRVTLYTLIYRCFLIWRRMNIIDGRRLYRSCRVSRLLGFFSLLLVVDPDSDEKGIICPYGGTFHGIHSRVRSSWKRCGFVGWIDIRLLVGLALILWNCGILGHCWYKLPN